MRVTPRKTLFTPVHAPVDLAMLAPCRETHKSYLNGGTSTLSDTWLVSSKGRDSEEWIGETRFKIEGCAHVPAQRLYAQRRDMRKLSSSGPLSYSSSLTG